MFPSEMRAGRAVPKHLLPRPRCACPRCSRGHAAVLSASLELPGRESRNNPKRSCTLLFAQPKPCLGSTLMCWSPLSLPVPALPPAPRRAPAGAAWIQPEPGAAMQPEQTPRTAAPLNPAAAPFINTALAPAVHISYVTR